MEKNNTENHKESDHKPEFDWIAFGNGQECLPPSNSDNYHIGEVEGLRKELLELRAERQADRDFIKMMSEKDRDLTKEDVYGILSHLEYNPVMEEDIIYYLNDGERYRVSVGQLPFISFNIEFYVFGSVNIERLKSLAYSITALLYTAKICISKFEYYYTLSFQVDYYAPSVCFFEESFDHYMKVLNGTRKLFSSLRLKYNL